MRWRLDACTEEKNGLAFPFDRPVAMISKTDHFHTPNGPSEIMTGLFRAFRARTSSRYALTKHERGPKALQGTSSDTPKLEKSHFAMRLAHSKPICKLSIEYLSRHGIAFSHIPCNYVILKAE
jgi:hypothetical protein